MDSLSPGQDRDCGPNKERTSTVPLIQVGAIVVQIKPAEKYLCIHRCTVDTPAKLVTALSKLMINASGPRSRKCQLLMVTVQSVLLYGKEVWAEKREGP